MYICTYVYMYVCLYVYIHTCLYVHIHLYMAFAIKTSLILKSHDNSGKLLICMPSLCFIKMNLEFVYLAGSFSQ